MEPWVGCDESGLVLWQDTPYSYARIRVGGNGGSMADLVYRLTDLEFRIDGLAKRVVELEKVGLDVLERERKAVREALVALGERREKEEALEGSG